MATAAVLVVSVLLCFVASSGAGSSFSSSGVPCYLHPSADGCHYTPRPDSDNCSTPAQRESMSRRIAIVNRTLAALELQLIRLGVIPPDNACSKLPSVDNGGVIYDDLNLAPGATGRYTCFEGYTLVSDAAGRYEYMCAEDGIWDGDVATAPVRCQLSSEKCSPPVDIANGTMVYLGNDSSNTLVGDMVTYSCLPGHEMVGVAQRFCLRTGNWSGEDPVCIQSKEIHDEGLITGGGSRRGLVLGSSLGSVAAAVAVAIVVVIIVSVMVYRKRKSKYRVYREERLSDDNAEGYQSFENPMDETDSTFNDSFEYTIEGSARGDLTQSAGKAHAGSKWKPSLQLIKETAISAAAKGREKIAATGHRSYSSSRVVVLKDDDEASL